MFILLQLYFEDFIEFIYAFVTYIRQTIVSQVQDGCYNARSHLMISCNNLIVYLNEQLARKLMAAYRYQ